MLIRETFATKVNEKIEPIVKVADRKPAVVYAELVNLIVTPQWARYLRSVLDAYADAADRAAEQGIGVWISGFFGSGKSLIMKILGVLLAGGVLNEQHIDELFLARLPANSPERADIQHLLAVIRRRVTTTAVGGNLHSMLTSDNDRLPLIVFKLFAEQRGYTHNWPLAWTVEYQIDEQGLSERFRSVASERTGLEWEDIVIDPEFYLEDLFAAAVSTLPNHFSSTAAVERAVNAAAQSGIDANRVVERFRRWCEQRDAEGRHHKLWLQLDELGQWIAAGNANDRINQVQALVEEAAESGGGRVWVTVTAHGDVQALRQNVQQEQYAKIIQRFALQCKLSHEDISQVVEGRVLQKVQTARILLEDRFDQRSGELVDLGRVERAQRVYPAPERGNFALFYPYLPWTVSVVPDVVKGIAQAANRDEALTGSNRTMIAVVQGALIESDVLTSPVGRLVALADLYPQLSADVAVETKTDLSKIAATVPGSTPFTTQVAYGLFLLGQTQYIPATLDNVTRTVVTDIGTNFAALRRQVKSELERLVAAGYAKLVGEHYAFLNTLQKSFQDKVRARKEELLGQSYDLIQELQEYKSETPLRFESAPIQERDIQLRLELDGAMIRNPTGAQVTVRIFSPLQRGLDPQIADDAAMRQRSAHEPNAIYLRMEDTPGFRAALALAAATDKVANELIARQQIDAGEAEVARLARQIDLPALKAEVRTLLAQAVRSGAIFFRGTAYQLAAGDNAGEAVRATLSQILPIIYPRFADVTHRIGNEQSAVRAALARNTTQADLRALGVYRADGELNEGHALVSALRNRLPLADEDQPPMSAADLRREFEAPPYGWDGNAVKVGLALLLRAAACRLIENGQIITDPSSALADQALTSESRFRSLRVQGIRSDLDPPRLLAIRAQMRQVFANVPANAALVAATLNNLLGEQLTQLAVRAGSLSSWSATIQCPLPLTFQADSAAVQELLNNGSTTGRLTAFGDQVERLGHFSASVTTLEHFRQAHGATFQAMRDFYNRMVNANAGLLAVNRFLSDYRAVIHEQTITEAPRWNELNHAYAAAQQAVDAQIAAWREEITARLAEVNANLEAEVRAANVPEEQVRDEAAALSTLYEPVRRQMEQDARSFGEVRGLLVQIAACELDANDRLRELRELYAVQPPHDMRRVTWQELAGGPVHVSSAAEMDALLSTLRDRIGGYLEEGDTHGLEIA
ncbi:MAG: BREX system P-loop protein BrxC [Caldilinea sp.]